MDLQERLTRYLSPPLFPVRLRDLPCQLTLHDVPLGSFRVGELEVIADLVCHPGPTLGYRIVEGKTSVAYLPDHEPALGSDGMPTDPRWLSGHELALGVNLLIHDAQYSEPEYADHVGWGHSSVLQALKFADAAQVERLVTFHHDPWHDDDTIVFANADRSEGLLRVSASGGEPELLTRPDLDNGEADHKWPTFCRAARMSCSRSIERVVVSRRWTLPFSILPPGNRRSSSEAGHTHVTRRRVTSFTAPRARCGRYRLISHGSK
ncbi:MAG: hypothetical protein IH905_05470 [Proteobacteria bacterium]|nr:hypothetical protein [Pseudomonadota bacterium]